MVIIPNPQTPPKLSSPSLPQAVRFFSPKQKRILIFASIVFAAILVSSAFAFYFWLTSFKKSQVDFAIAGPDQVASGDSAVYTISYWNNTDQIIQNAVLTIRYPQDAVVGGDKIIQSVDLGNIGVGGGGKREITAAFIGPDKSIKKLGAVLSYKPQNTSSTFENDALKDIAISGSALSVDFKAPEAALPNAKNTYTIHYKNNLDKAFRNISIEVVYPENFKFISADKAPAKENNIWNIGDLNPNEEGDILFSGILGADASASFESAIGVVENNIFYKFSRSSSQVNLAALPLKLEISANDRRDFSVNPGDNLRFKIHYENNSGIALSEVVLKARLNGSMYDFSTLKTSGYFSGANNTITWSAGNVSDFKSLPSGASGDVEFQINAKSQYPIKTFRDRNFLLQVSAEMNTPTAPPSLAAKSLSVAGDFSLKVNTKAVLKTKGYYFDSAIKNSGPLPPKVGQTTTYSVHWQITNYSNDIGDVVVKTVLPEGVSWLNKKAGAGADTLEHNDRTGELVWSVGKVAAGTGILLNYYEVIFQVGLTPSVGKANSVVPILSESALTANDTFTGNGISITAPALKTDLPDDPGVGYLKSRVQP
ncbi:DUF11 domain-containing protein [Candidatus Azambacteria bacterium]|nr:DUF11 domain-containing protein [Candidatus Azambacteria bacterium]